MSWENEIRESAGWDMEKYNGIRTTIAGYEVKWVEPKGKYAERRTVNREGKAPILRVYTEVLGKEKRNDGIEAEIRGSEIFSLSCDRDGNILPPHVKSNLGRFLRSVGAKTVKDLVGKKVVTNIRQTERGGNTLEFVGFYKM